jgi:hypothetical protein
MSNKIVLVQINNNYELMYIRIKDVFNINFVFQKIQPYYDLKARKYIIPFDKKKVFCEAVAYFSIVEVYDGGYDIQPVFLEDSDSENDTNEKYINNLRLKKVRALSEMLEDDIDYLRTKILHLQNACFDANDVEVLEKMYNNMITVNKQMQEFKICQKDYQFAFTKF